MCHLIKRVSLQSADRLKACAHIAMPLLLRSFADQRTNVRTTAKSIFLEYWRNCPGEGDVCLRNVGFEDPQDEVRMECINVLKERLAIESFAFRPFTASVVKMLADGPGTVRQAALSVIVMFFATAPVRAKVDLQRELTKSQVDTEVSNTILRQIGMLKGRETPDPLRQHGSRFTSPVKPVSSQTQPRFSANSKAMIGGNVAARQLNSIWACNEQGYAMENLAPEYVDSLEHIEELTEQMRIYFDGKETEQNWQLREKGVKKLRAILRGNSVTSYREGTILMLKELADGICKSASSLRTSLSSTGCNLVKDAAMILKHDMIIEPFLTTMVKLSMGAKKITAQSAAIVINAMIINTTYTSRYLYHCQQVMAEKIAQAKAYCASWLRLIICCHHQCRYLDDTILEQCLVRALSDPNPLVRESMRRAYWDYFEIRPTRAKIIFKDLDLNVRKALDRVNPSQSESYQDSSSLSSSSAFSRATSQQQAPLKLTRAARSVARDHFAKQSVDRPTPVANRSSVLSHSQLPSAGSTVSQRLGSPSAEKKSGQSSPIISDAYIEKRMESIFDTANSKLDDMNVTSSSPQIKPSLSLKEMLINSDSSVFQSAISILVRLLKGENIPSTVNCVTPIQLPPSQVIEGAFTRAFQHSPSYVYVYPDAVRELCSSDMLQSSLQFVGGRHIMDGLAFCAYDGDTFGANMDRISAFFSKVEMFNSLCYLAQLLHTYTGTKQVQSCLDFLCSAASDLEEADVQAGLEHLDALGAEHNESVTNIRESLKKPVDTVPDDHQGSPCPDRSSNSTMMVDAEEELHPEDPVDPVEGSKDEHSMDEGHNGNESQQEEIVVESKEVDDAHSAVTDIHPQNGDDLELTQTKLTAMEIDTNENSKENVSPTRENNASTKSVVASMPLTPSKKSQPPAATPFQSKISMFQTPVRLESKHDSLDNFMRTLSPLPQNDEEAHKLFETLVSDVFNAKVDAYGCRKLSMAVRRSKADGSEPAHRVWKREHWLLRLQDALLKYLNNETLDEVQLSHGLMLISGMLEYDPESFDGQEHELVRKLAVSTNRPSAVKVGLSRYASIEECLLKRCQRDEEVAAKVLSVTLDCFDAASTNTSTMFLLELLSNTLQKCSFSGQGNVVQDSLPKILQEAIKNIGETNSARRYKAYTILDALKRLYGADNANLRSCLQQAVSEHCLSDESSKMVSHCIPL